MYLIQVIFHIFPVDIMRKFKAFAIQEKMTWKLDKLNSIHLHLNLMNM